MNHNHFVPANGSSVGSSVVPDQGQATGANTGSTRTHKSAGKVIDLKPKEAVRPHVKVSLEDINWVRSQPPCVQQLWLDCAAAEQFGSQQRALKTSLSKNAFFKAKSALEARGLFEFERIYSLSKAGRGIVVGWKVENLHGYYRKNYWELLSHEMTTESHFVTAESHFVTAESHFVTAESHFVGEETAKTLTTTKLENSQPSPNQVSTTHQPPTKVVGGVVSILKEEDLPQGATDCPTLTGGIGSDDKSESQLGAEPPDPQTQSLEARLPGGEILSPPKGDPPLVVNQGEEVSVQFLKGGTEFTESVNSLASLEVEEAANEESKNLGEENFPSAPVQFETSEIEEPPKVEVTSIMSPSFPQMGDKAVLDWPESLYHQKVGTIQAVHTESKEAEIRFDGMDCDLTFLTSRLLPAAVVSFDQAAGSALTQPTAGEEASAAEFKIGDRVWWNNVPRHADFGEPFEITRFIGNTAWLQGYSRRAVPLSELRPADASDLET